MIENKSTRKKNTFLTFSQRKKLRNDIKIGLKNEVLLNKYDISLSTLKLERFNSKNNIPIPENIHSERKKIQLVKYSEIENYILEKLEKLRFKGFNVSGPYLQLLAREESRKIIENETSDIVLVEKYSSATFGKSWLEGFKTQHDLRNIRVNGERASVAPDLELLMNPVLKFIAEKKCSNIPYLQHG